MLSIIDIAPNVLAYRAEGRIGKADIDSVFAEIDRLLEGGGKVRIFAEVVSLAGLTPDAVWRDFRLGVQHWRAVDQIEKAALVTDLEWLRRLAGGGSERVIAGVRIRVFSMAERQQAVTWMQE